MVFLGAMTLCALGLQVWIWELRRCMWRKCSWITCTQWPSMKPRNEILCGSWTLCCGTCVVSGPDPAPWEAGTPIPAGGSSFHWAEGADVGSESGGEGRGQVSVDNKEKVLCKCKMLWCGFLLPSTCQILGAQSHCQETSSVFAQPHPLLVSLWPWDPGDSTQPYPWVHCRLCKLFFSIFFGFLVRACQVNEDRKVSPFLYLQNVLCKFLCCSFKNCMSCTFLLQFQGDLSRVSKAVPHLKRRESDLFTSLVLLLARCDLCFTRL